MLDVYMYFVVTHTGFDLFLPWSFLVGLSIEEEKKLPFYLPLSLVDLIDRGERTSNLSCVYFGRFDRQRRRTGPSRANAYRFIMRARFSHEDQLASNIIFICCFHFFTFVMMMVVVVVMMVAAAFLFVLFHCLYIFVLDSCV